MDIVGLVIGVDGAIDSELSHGQTFDRIMIAMYELYIVMKKKLSKCEGT